MNAVLLAAGTGTRFKGAARGLPKPMAPVGGKPLLEHAIEHVRSCGIRRVCINLHYRPEAIRGYFGDGRKWGVDITYSFEERLLGTAGTVRNLARELDDPFLVYYSDNFCSCDLNSMIRFHGEKGALATILVSESYDALAGGVIACDEAGRVTGFLEKPPAGDGVRLENGGIYVCAKDVIKYIPARAPSDFGRDVFPAVLRAGKPLYCYRAEGFVRGIDTPQRYRALQEELREGTLGRTPEGA